MAETDTTETTATEEKPSGKSEEEQHVPYERFKQANTQAKEAKDEAKKLAGELADLKTQLEQRDQQGLPELERAKQEAEKADKRAEAAEEKAQEFERKAQNAQRERWVASAAAELTFHDPEDAPRYVDLADIESVEDAQRAVKAVAKRKEHLVKSDERQLPGQVLKDGQRAEPTKKNGGIDLDEEAQMVSDNLKQFLKNR